MRGDGRAPTKSADRRAIERRAIDRARHFGNQRTVGIGVRTKPGGHRVEPAG